MLLRLLLMPFTIMEDIMEISWLSSFILQGHVNVYVYYFQRFQTIYFPPGTYGTIAAQFPPISYLFEAGYLFILEKLGIFSFPTFWAQLQSGMACYMPCNGMTLMPTLDANRFFFIVKLPYLAFDILGLVMLLGVLEKKYRRAGAAAWMLNPFILYISYGWGQTDIIAASLTAVALYFAKRTYTTKNTRPGLLACLALGLAASFKLYPLALLPIFAIFAATNTRKHWFRYVAAGLLPFVVVIPFISTSFINMIFPLQGFLTAHEFPGANPLMYTIVPAFAIYLVLIYYLISKYDLPFGTILSASLGVFAILYGFGIWIPNWFVWGIPFVLPIVITRPRLFVVYVLVTVFYFMFASAWGTWLWLGLFYPLTDPVFGSGPLWTFPNLWDMIPTWSGLINLAYTGIGASMFFLVYRSLKRESTTKDHPIGPIRWGALLLIPLSLAALNLYLGRTFLTRLDLWNTLASKIEADPIFFDVYFTVVALTILLVLAAMYVTAAKKFRTYPKLSWRNWPFKKRNTRVLRRSTIKLNAVLADGVC